MIYDKIGQIFEYEGVAYEIGMKIRTTVDSDYSELEGFIIEIRTEGDMETENDDLDIYCTITPPKTREGINGIEKLFSQMYRQALTLEGIEFDCVIISSCDIEIIRTETMI